MLKGCAHGQRAGKAVINLTRDPSTARHRPSSFTNFNEQNKDPIWKELISK